MKNGLVFKIIASILVIASLVGVLVFALVNINRFDPNEELNRLLTNIETEQATYVSFETALVKGDLQIYGKQNYAVEAGTLLNLFTVSAVCNEGNLESGDSSLKYLCTATSIASIVLDYTDVDVTDKIFTEPLDFVATDDDYLHATIVKGNTTYDIAVKENELVVTFDSFLLGTTTLTVHDGIVKPVTEYQK